MRTHPIPWGYLKTHTRISIHNDYIHIIHTLLPFNSSCLDRRDAEFHIKRVWSTGWGGWGGFCFFDLRICFFFRIRVRGCSGWTNELFPFISVLPFSHTLCSEGSDDEGSERRNKQTLTSCMMLFQNIFGSSDDDSDDKRWGLMTTTTVAGTALRDKSLHKSFRWTAVTSVGFLCPKSSSHSAAFPSFPYAVRCPR